MNVTRFPVLAPEDRDVVEEFAVGLGEDRARALAYLHLRRTAEEFDDGPAPLVAVRVGTELNRNAAETALQRLDETGIVDATTLPTEGQGRPPRAWTVTGDRDALRDRTYRRHASALLDRADAVADRFETDVAGGSFDTPAGDPGDADATTVSLNWRPNGLHVPLFGARQADEYAGRGRAVSLAHRTGSDEALADVAAGTATVGVVGAATLLRAVASATPVVPVALLYQRAPAVLYATRASFGEPFERAAQLRGRRLGMPVDSEIGLLGRLFLEQAGVAGDVTVVDLEGEEGEALRAGRVDAVTGSFSDPYRLRGEDVTVDSVPVADRFPIYGPALVVRRDALTRRRDLLADVLAGTMAGLAAAKRDPGDAVAATAAAGRDSERQIRWTFRAATDRFGTSDDVRTHGWGWQRAESWLRLVDVLEQVGLLEASETADSG